MKKIVLVGLLFVCPNLFQAVYAQAPEHKWQTNPTIHQIPEPFAKESAVFVLESEVEDYTREFGTTYVLNTVHRIIKVLDDKGIEAFNTMTITNNGIEVREIKARVILPSGKILDVPKDKILESKSENNLQQFVFALEGLEKNAEVEMQYTIKYNFSLFGTEYFQFAIPVMHAAFELKCPSFLVFETKGYNGFPAAKDSINADTSSDFNRIYRCAMDNIPALKEEESSNYYANIMRLEYRIAYLPESKPNQRQFTWNDLARNMFEATYNFTEKETKIVQKYLKSIGVDPAEDELSKIRKIEEHLKVDINIVKEADETSEKFDVIVAKKMTTEDGLKRFFAACFTVAGIQHELGITSNRYDHVLDEKFENWKPLDYYIFYFPQQKMYLAPAATVARAPFLPSPFLMNKAVFCKITTLGTIQTALANVRTINPMPREMTYNNLQAEVHFKGDNLNPEITQTQSFAGYSAMGYREAFLYVSKDQEKELVSKITDIAASIEDITKYTIQNTALDNYYANKPLELSTTISANKLMEKAGAKYLFKIGDVIGRQAEMYQAEERKLPIETAYPHGLKRKIIMHIPEGYKVTNPEVTAMNIVHQDEKTKQNTMAFISSYTIEQNTMAIDINEYYDVMILPANEYASFSKVINAAADFNKLVLVLEKK
jgi:hypothetical protein